MIRRFLWTFLCCSCGISTALAATLRVPVDFPTIPAAMQAAQEGDVVLVAPGEYLLSAPVRFGGKGVKLLAEAGAAETILRLRNPADPLRANLISFDAAEPGSAVVEGFTLVGGLGQKRNVRWIDMPVGVDLQVGGAIYVGSHVDAHINFCEFVGNTAEYGGAIFCDVDSSPIISNCVFTENSCSPSRIRDRNRGGAIACMPDSVITIGGTRFVGNSSDDGGAVFAANDTTLEILTSSFERNVSRDDGGALLFAGSSLDLLNSTFRGNLAADQGGGAKVRTLMAPGARRRVNVTECLFEESSAAAGAGLYLEAFSTFPVQPPLQLQRSRFVANRAAGAGGGLSTGYGSDTLEVTGCVFERNSAQEGGGAYLDYDSQTTFDDCLFRSNLATRGGGVSAPEVRTSIFRNCVLRDNVALQTGGAYFYSTGAQARLFDHCTVAGNAAAREHGGIGRPTGVSPLFGQIRSSIFWDNLGGSMYSPADVSFSCMEGPEVLPVGGAGNLQVDPLFAGWRRSGDVFIDPRAPGPGDGSSEKPFQAPEEALQAYSLSLIVGSPCIGTGAAGSNMGAPLAVAPGAGGLPPTLRLSSGSHDVGHLGFLQGADLIGEGPTRTFVTGPLIVSRSARIADLSMIGGLGVGVAFGPGARTLLQNCSIREVPPAPWGENSFYLPVSLGVAWGIYCARTSAPVIDHCTIHGIGAAIARVEAPASPCGQDDPQVDGGLLAETGSDPQLQSSIIWGNPGRSILGALRSSHSAVEGAALAGEGNLQLDPRFEGWRGLTELHVDPAAPPGGDGSSDRPLDGLEGIAATYSLALTDGSPCLGTGVGGSNMGADLGVAPESGQRTRVLRLAPGHYDGSQIPLHLELDVLGSGPAATTIQGALVGARSGRVLKGFTLVGPGTGGPAGIFVGACQAPVIEEVVFDSLIQAVSLSHASPTIRQCKFSRCIFAVTAVRESAPAISASVFESINYAFGLDRSSVAVQSSLLVGVGVVVYALQVPNSSAVFTHCTMDANLDFSQGCNSAALKLVNCILPAAWTCHSPAENLITSSPGYVRPAVFDYSRFVPVFGSGGFYVPDFILTPGDYHLSENSRAIDAAPATQPPGTDLDGNARPCGAGPDFGAYERGGCGQNRFRRGEINGDGRLDLTDAVAILGYLFLGQETPHCLASADADDNGNLDLSDPIRILRFLFLGDSAPPAPFETCGGDPTPDALGCAVSSGC